MTLTERKRMAWTGEQAKLEMQNNQPKDDGEGNCEEEKKERRCSKNDKNGSGGGGGG